MGIDVVPAHGLCLSCAWVCEQVPGPEGMAIYDQIKGAAPGAIMGGFGKGDDR